MTESRTLEQERADAEQSSLDEAAIAAAALVALQRRGGVAALLGLRGAATRRQAQRELARRALYGINAARRVGGNVARGRAIGEALAVEGTYLRQHREARSHRMTSAQAVDGAAGAYGDVLGWYAIRDDRTTVDCADAHGQNFRAANPPSIGYPGTVHGRCRCSPGAPHAGAVLLA